MNISVILFLETNGLVLTWFMKYISFVYFFVTDFTSSILFALTSLKLFYQGLSPEFLRTISASIAPPEEYIL